jgi:hypothetical protein
MLRVAILTLLLALLGSCSQPPGDRGTTPEQQAAPGWELVKPERQATLGWDLTYSSVLEKNNIAHDEWLWKWLGKDYQSPIQAILEHWNDEAIISSILIEHPQFHAGDHMAFWFVRTKEHAYYWGFIKGKPEKNVKEILSAEIYDRVFEQMSSWRQAEPMKPENTPNGGVPGYLGFLSLYDRGNSRQMLLSVEDFYVREPNAPEGYKEGRVVLAFKTLKKKLNAIADG